MSESMNKLQRADAKRLQYFGDEQSRLENFSEMNYQNFKGWLLGVRNGLPKGGEYEDFTDWQMVSGDGESFPQGSEKEPLMRYALEQAQAQDDMQNAALIVGMGIIAVHPFMDGNGRTSRRAYAMLSRGWTATTRGYKRLGMHGSSNTVDFGPILNDEPYKMIKKIIYTEADLVPYTNNISYKSTLQPHLNFSVFTRKLSTKKWMDVWGEHNRAGRDAAMFALSKLAIEGYGPFPFEEDEKGFTTVNMPETLTVLDDDTVAKVDSYAQDYHTARAKAAIDSLGKYGGLKYKLASGIDISVREFLITQINSFLACHVTS